MFRVIFIALLLVSVASAVTLLSDSRLVTGAVNKTLSSTYRDSTLKVTDPGKLVVDPISTIPAPALDSEDGKSPGEPELIHYAWQWFSQLTTTQPDSKVFSQFRATSSVFRLDGKRPSTWSSGPELPQAVRNYAAQRGIANDAQWHNLDTVAQVDGLALQDKWLRPVRYQLLMNQPAFEYLVAQGLYNANGIVAHEGEIRFPDNAVELKTSWIWIKDDEQRKALMPHYYIGHAYYQDNSGYEIGEAALTGIHIAPKAGRDDWVWMTFENSQNEYFTNINYKLPITRAVKQSNANNPLRRPIAGTIFENYRLNGVQTGFLRNGNPDLLANSQIESNFQSSSSCITCHSLASYQSDPTLKYFNFVDSSGNGTAYYTGTPPSIYFWKSMDFAWSLRRANWLRD